MLSVQNYNLTANKNMAFKGKSEDTENKPFQTHAGLKTGIVAGTIGGGGALLEGYAAKRIDEVIKLGGKSQNISNDTRSMMQEVVEFMNSAKKTAKIMATAIPLSAPSVVPSAERLSPSSFKRKPSLVKSMGQSGVFSQTMSMCPCKITGGWFS